MKDEAWAAYGLVRRDRHSTKDHFDFFFALFCVLFVSYILTGDVASEKRNQEGPVSEREP